MIIIQKLNIIGEKPVFNKKSEADQNHEFIERLHAGEPIWKPKFNTPLFWGYIIKKYIIDNPYIPHVPYQRQLLPICDHTRQVLLGGSLGGSKTELLLILALMFVSVNGYKAAIVRNQLSSIRKSDSVWSRTVQWLMTSNMKKGRDFTINKQDNIIAFPQFGSEIDFIHSGDQSAQEKTLGRYASSQFSTMLFEELFENPDDYAFKFLQSRLRKPIDLDLNIRLRIATNPPEFSDKNKRYLAYMFIPEEEISTPFNKLDIHAVYHEGKSFYPLGFHSNPYIDSEEYIESLGDLSKNDKLRLIDGRWDISAHSQGELFTQQDLDAISIDQNDLPSDYNLIIIGIDTSGNIGSDATTFSTIGFKDNKIYIIESKEIEPIKNRYNTFDDESRRLTDLKLVDEIESQFEKYGRLDFIIRESPIKAEDARISKYFNEIFSDLLSKTNAQMLSLAPLKSKYERLKAYSHLMKGSNPIISLSDNITEYNELCAQFIYITFDKKQMNKLPSPDLVDSISIAMQFILDRILKTSRHSTSFVKMKPKISRINRIKPKASSKRQNTRISSYKI